MESILRQFGEYTVQYDTTTESVSPGLMTALLIFAFAALILFIAASWRVYTKAGKPGWAALIPIYNTYIILKIIGRPGWWLLLYLVPFVNFIVMIIVFHELAKVFGKGVGFTLLLIFVPILGWPMLAWGDAKYQGPIAR